MMNKLQLKPRELKIISVIAATHSIGDAAALLAQWEQGNRQGLERGQRLLAELQETPGSDLAMLSVALRELRNLV